MELTAFKIAETFVKRKMFPDTADGHAEWLTAKEDCAIQINLLVQQQVKFIGFNLPVSGQLNCPNCKRKTKTLNHDETMACCFHCGTKWAI